MTPTLVRQQLSDTGAAPPADHSARARDWAEIQERMLVPLYEAVYERLDVGPGTRLLGLGCGSGLALLMAASRGASVTGVDSGAPDRLELARERLLPDGGGTRAAATHPGTRLVAGDPEDTVDERTPAYTVVTAFEPVGCATGDTEELGALLAGATPLARRGAPVVLVGWGPPERCVTSAVLRVASRPADPLRGTGGWRAPGRDDLEEVAQRAGLRPDGGGRVACPFGYADVDSAVRGLMSTGFFDPAMAAADRVQVDKEVREAVHPYRRADGAVWMPNVFRYLIARTA